MSVLTNWNQPNVFQWTAGCFILISLLFAPSVCGAAQDQNTASQTDPPIYESIYAVGLIDLTAGQQNVSGNLEPVADTDEYQDQLYVDGRVAFYLKGKVKGKYLLTAQLDTGVEPVHKAFNHLGKPDPQKAYEKIDPEKYYPVYGDESSIVNDARSRGKLYVRLEWDKSRVLWGDYQADLNDTTLMRYNRSLYGFQADLQSRDASRSGKFFWAEPLTVHSQDEFKSTGGMLYYLKHANLVLGSEQLSAEIRSSISDETISVIALESGRDYQIDYLQGRIILQRDLTAVINSGLITTNAAQSGNPVYLIAAYEFEQDNLSGQSNMGLKVGQTLFNRLQLGATAVQESLDGGGDYRLYGGDYRFDLTPNITFSGEYAQSEQSPTHRYYSEDGGLSFVQFQSSSDNTVSDAWKLGLEMAFTGFDLKSYYLFQEQGFSAQNRQALNNISEANLELSTQFNSVVSGLLQYNRVEEENVKDKSKVVLQLQESFQKWQLTEEVRLQQLDSFTATDPSEYRDTLGALRLDYRLNDAVALYGITQYTLDRSETTPENNRNTLGADLTITPKFHLNLEQSQGDLGDLATLGADYQLNEAQQIYGKAQSGRDAYQGSIFQSLLGTKTTTSAKTNFYTENKLVNSTYEKSNANLYGFDFAPAPGWLFSVDYTTSTAAKLADRPTTYESYLETDSTLIPDVTVSGAQIDRRIAGLSIAYRDLGLEYKTRLQVRYDEGDETVRQYVMTNRFKQRFNHEWTGFAKLNYSLTHNKTTAIDTARFIEGSLGLAYRPVTNDRFNLIGQYTYLEDLSPDQQEDGTVPSERSQVLALDLIYDLNARWQLGEKLAYKQTAVKQVDDAADWITGDLYLWVNKVNYHIVKQWDLYGEYRTLWSTLAEDSKSGALFAVYYLFDPGMRIGMGYNFTDFNDDLAHLGYRANGWFINFTKAW